TASYTSGGVSNDIVVEGSGTTYTLNFDKTYSTTYEVTVSGMVDGETVTATQSYTTIDEPVQINIDPTTVTTTWPLPTQTGSSIIDNTLAIVDCHAVTDTYFSLKRIDQTGDKPGYMYFLIPAATEGRLIIDAMSDTRDVYYYTTTNTTILTASELDAIQQSGQATMMGQPTLTGSTLTAEISSDADQMLVYIFNRRGQIDYQSVTWSLEPYYITSVSPANGTTVDAGSDITVTYNSEVNMPTITVNGEPVTVTTNDNLTFTVTGVTTDANTTYNVVVSATTAVAGGENVVGKEWSFMTSVPAEEKYLRIAGDEITLPADASTTIEVVVPYYSTVNYQDIESVRASIESYGYNVGTLTMADDVFNTEYNLVVDGTTYHLRMQRAAFMTSGELKLGDSTAYALYLMPTQPMEDGNETYAMTLVADVADETIMQQTPTFTGDFVYVNGSETVTIPAENIHVGNLKNIYFLNGYSYSEGEITFTYEGMDVKVLYLLNWTPGVGEWRVWTVEEIPAEMYIPNGDNSIVFRGVTIYGSAGTPTTPVRVTWFDINDPSNTFTLDGYGPFSKSLKMGGRVDDQANPQHRYLKLNATQGGELGSGAEVITMLVCNGSNTHESKFQMRGSSGITTQERLLPRGGAAWWSFRNSASTTIDMYGYDSGTNAEPKGGNVQYIFLEAAPGKEFNPFTEADFNVKVDMNTVKVGEATRVLASTANRITVTVKTKLGDDAIISYRQSKLNIRKIGALTGDADMTASNVDVMANAQGANVPLEDQYAVNVISESQSGPDADGYTTMTVVIESQVPLEGNTTYELWSSDATFVLNKETIGGIYTNPVSYAAPLYIIHTAQDQEFDYDFENAATADARLFPSNVYPAEYTTSVGVVSSTAATDVPFIEKNGSYILEVSGANNAMKVGFDTPADYPGAQSQTEGYKYIHFDIYVPSTDGTTTPKVSLYTAEGELIPLVATDANWTYNDHLQESVPDKGSDVESVDLSNGLWIENVRAASAVAGYWFPAFAATDRIYLSIEGANTAYVDNVTFVDANTNDFPTGIEELNNGKTIFYNGREVVNPTENRVEVYNIAGVMVMSQKGNADLSRLAKGIYIVRCGNEILKIRR
ncbi:MAG TPA: T9SS type A sorting domain-containing protein, partial [Candidatus Barnesiella excrementipullorum]|nr:T9SS type A sorting domain-containing protein [Candidatus Barnesiella excrementipullorum]